ncbi:MAG: methylase [Spirochaetaceae bacterium]|nr:methylase [Spirochaetaceae bacterium]
MSLSEIRIRAAAFVSDWQEKAPLAREEADAQTFEAEFLAIFGVSRKQQAIFEYRVPLGGDTSGAQKGYIDLFWKKHILIEMKSPGKDLQKAYQQAKTYAHALPAQDLPRGILICDFLNFHYYDLTKDAALHTFRLAELPQRIDLFSYLAGYHAIEFKEWDPVNLEAAQLMGTLHDRLKAIGYSGHQVEQYLVRLLFCLFADDTGIFDTPKIFLRYIIDRTSPDGSDLAAHLALIFDTLNKPKEKRLKTIDEQLNQFPYVNGGLFKDQLDLACFDSAMRETLITCCSLDWSKISPAIFGAMFQSVKDKDARRTLGEHYTSEANILKVIKPLFLEGLRAEFAQIQSLSGAGKKQRLSTFHEKLSQLAFLDPACGCGNFLVVSYRELRLLEIEVIRERLGSERELDLELLVKVNVSQFYGIELEDFPAEIARTALWLMDHLMNKLVSETFGRYYVRIPLTTSATIIQGNALTLDWASLIPPAGLSFILGNPPFLGKKEQSVAQKSELERIFTQKGQGVLDYVACWYKKAAQYISGTAIECAFVSTNSICQGEQVAVLWQNLMNQHGIKINFAHQMFKWSNEAKGKAAVHCVIIGFSLFDRSEKKLFFYETVKTLAKSATVKQINPYLIDAPVIFIDKRAEPLCKGIAKMVFGSMPNDGGNFLLNEAEKDELITEESAIAGYIRPFLGADEFINGIKRSCIWLKGVAPEHYSHSKGIMKRIAAVKAYRLGSSRYATQRLADFPMLFGEIRQPDSDYLLIPRVSSEKRDYIPLGFIDKNTIASDSTHIISNATLYEFGVLTSSMHMAWMRRVCGRLGMSYRYSASIVYNNFPWSSPTDKQRAAVETAAQSVLDARALFPNSSFADLYDPLTMPSELVQAHQRLDTAVDKAYGRSFAHDSERVAYLFELYQKLSGELFRETTKRGKGRKVGQTSPSK